MKVDVKYKKILYKSLNEIKNVKKIKDVDFKILNYDEWELLKHYNFKISQLKKIAKK